MGTVRCQETRPECGRIPIRLLVSAFTGFCDPPRRKRDDERHSDYACFCRYCRVSVVGLRFFMDASDGAARGMETALAAAPGGLHGIRGARSVWRAYEGRLAAILS